MEFSYEEGNGSCFSYAKCKFAYVSVHKPLVSYHTMLILSSHHATITVSMSKSAMQSLVQPGCSLLQSLSSSWYVANFKQPTIVVILCMFVAQKAGFMLIEISFARNPKEKRYVVVLVRCANNVGMQRHIIEVYASHF